MLEANIAIGIDLGTTNTCAAVYRNGRIEMIWNKQGHFITPSCVTYLDKQVVVGKIAVDHVFSNLKNTVFGVKRIIGRKFDDPAVQSVINNWKLNVRDFSGTPKIEVVYKGEKSYVSPEEVSGHILKEVKEAAEQCLEVPSIIDAVITVPAYFNDHQRRATVDAAKIAGLNVLKLINEPTAAAVAYLYDRPQKMKRNILIYDLGGGTFDVSIVYLEGSNIRVKATHGNTNLGGMNFDEECIAHFLKIIKEKYKIDTKKATKMKYLYRLRNAVQNAKHDLSTMESTFIELLSIYDGVDVKEDFYRARFENLNQHLFAETFKIVEDCITRAGLTREEIDDVVLVGGSTKICKIQDGLKEYFRKPISKAIHPDHAVAHGAAVLAANIKGTLPETLHILDVTAMSLGVEVLNGEMDVLIQSNVQIPVSAQRTYTIGVEGESAVRLIILEGDNPIAKHNVTLGVIDLVDLLTDPSIEVTFNVDTNGILSVEVVEASSTAKAKITLNKGGLTSNEVTMLKCNSIASGKDNEEYCALKSRRNKVEEKLLKLRKDLSRNSRSNFGEKNALLMNIDALLQMATEELDNFSELEDKYETIIGGNQYSKDKK